MEAVEAKLYEFAVVLNEKRDRDGEIVEEAQVIVEPKTILARNDNQAQMLAARAIPEEHTKDGKLDRVVVAVRPF